MKRLAALFGALSLFGCAPLTFSEPGALDFERYRSALVAGDGAEYLAKELAEFSGFESVTTDTRARVDVIISVSISTVEHRTCQCDCDCATCTCDSDFEATARFVARSPAGELVLSGSESDVSESEGEAIHDALDEVALVFVRPYRI